MDKKDLFLLGRIVKTDGFDGKLLAALDVDSTEKYQQLDEIYLEEGPAFTKYPVSDYVLNKNKTASLRIAGCCSDAEAKKYLKAAIYLPLSFLPPLVGNTFYHHEISGFEVIDSVRGGIGKVKDIIELPHQKLLQVLASGKEILIPILKDTLEKIDRTEKKLYVRTPEGLIDVYLNTNNKEEE